MLTRPAIALASALLALTCGCAPGQPPPATEDPDELGDNLASPSEPVTFRVGNYNIQWFGATDAGPQDEELQLERAAIVMAASDVDLWVLSEIVDADHFDALVASLPGYAGLLASDPEVADGSTYYRADEQKLAIVYREAVVQLAAPRIILASHAHDFASRPPLALDVTVRDGGAALQFTLIGVHMKAMADLDSYQRRQRGSLALHGFLDSELADRSLLVFGDWNDDIDTSIVSGRPTPFADLASDGDYRFLTRELSLANVGSRVTGHSFIDHQLAGGAIRDHHVDGSTQRIEAGQLVSAYGSTTSDHYPIVSTFELPSEQRIVINEVLANEPGSDTAREFVELVAIGCEPLALSGYRLHFDGEEVFRFPSSTVLMPGQAAVVFSRASAVPPDLPRAFAAGGLGLLNRAGEVTLADDSGAALGSVSWSTSTDGVSITRAVDGDASSQLVSHPLRQARNSSPGATIEGASTFAHCASDAP